MPWFGCVWFVLLEWADGMCQDNEFKGVKFWKIMGCGSRIILDSSYHRDEHYF